MSDHRFPSRISGADAARGRDPFDRLIDHPLPNDDRVYTVIRLLPYEFTKLSYQVEGSNGTVHLVHESQFVASSKKN
jgi:hypothetical protein